MKLPLVLLLLSLPARAALHLEPYASGSTGGWGADRAQVGIETEMHGNSTSFGYGARLKLSHKYVFIGLEYGEREVLWLYNKMPATPADDNWEGRVSGKERIYGPMLGLKNLNSTFFLWYTMFSMTDLIFHKDQDPAEPAPTYKGKGMAVGIALSLAKYLSVGFEYQRKSYDTLRQSGTDYPMPGYAATGNTIFSKMVRDEYQVFASIPFIFWGGK